MERVRRTIRSPTSLENSDTLNRAQCEPAPLRQFVLNVVTKSQEPKRVRLVEDYLDLKVGMAYKSGTILVRSPWSGQYMIEGTRLGGECIAYFSLIRGICEVVEQ